MYLSPEIRIAILNQSSVASAIVALADEYGRSGETMTTVQIGACNGAIENDHLQKTIRDRVFVRAHLIEAVDWLYDDLVNVMEPYEDRVSCYNLAVCREDGYRDFFSAAKRLGTDQPDRQKWQLYQIGSLHRGNLSGYIPNEYIECKKVRCLSPKRFLSIANLDPRDLDLLAVDAEGTDAEIVCGFLEVSRPNMIVYEHKIIPEHDHNSLLQEFVIRGYQYKKIGDDILAIR